jgi:hypothetical protein
MRAKHAGRVNAVSRQTPIEDVVTRYRFDTQALSKLQRGYCVGNRIDVFGTGQHRNIVTPIAKGEQGSNGNLQAVKDLRIAERSVVGQRTIGPKRDHLPAIVYEAES